MVLTTSSVTPLPRPITLALGILGCLYLAFNQFYNPGFERKPSSFRLASDSSTSSTTISTTSETYEETYPGTTIDDFPAWSPEEEFSIQAPPDYPRHKALFQPDGLTKTLILPKRHEDDISWLDKLPSWLNASTAVHLVDPPENEETNDGFLRVPANKGNEAMVYLTYIITHYDNLPDIMVFLHSHSRAWHNNDFQDDSTPLMLQELNYHRAHKHGFMNLRCHWRPGCPNWLHPIKRDDDTLLHRPNPEAEEEFIYGEAFQQLFGPDHKIPETVAAMGGAQFAVTRERVRQNPLHEYIAYREWLLQTKLENALSGRVMEYIWHYIFSPRENREAVVCPMEHICYCDGYGLCFGNDAEFKDYMQLRTVNEGLRKYLRGDHAAEMSEAKRLSLKSQVLNNRMTLREWERRARMRGADTEERKREVGEKEFSG